MSYGSEPIYFMVHFDGLLPGLLQKMHKLHSPEGGGVLPLQSPEQKVKCEARGWAVMCAPSAEGAAWSFANPSLEVKLQTLAKEKGCVEGESTGLPPTPKEMTTKKRTKKRKNKRNEGRKPAELTTLRVNFSKEVLRPCSLSGFRNKKKKGREKNTEKKNLQLTCGFQTAQRQLMNKNKSKTGRKNGKREAASAVCESQWESQKTEAHGKRAASLEQ